MAAPASPTLASDPVLPASGDTTSLSGIFYSTMVVVQTTVVEAPATSTPTSTSKSNGVSPAVPAVASAAATLIISFLAFVIYYKRRRSQKKKRRSRRATAQPMALVDEEQSLAGNPRTSRASLLGCRVVLPNN